MAAWSRSRVSLDEDDRVHASRAGAGAVLDAPFTRSLAGCARERGVPSATPGKLWKSVRPFRQFSNSRRDRSSRCSARAGLLVQIPVPRSSCSCATPRPVLHSKIPILAQDFNSIYPSEKGRRTASGADQRRESSECKPQARDQNITSRLLATPLKPVDANPWVALSSTLSDISNNNNNLNSTPQCPTKYGAVERYG